MHYSAPYTSALCNACMHVTELVLSPERLWQREAESLIFFTYFIRLSVMSVLCMNRTVSASIRVLC